MRPAYEEQVRAFAEQYLPSEGIKIYTEIKNGGSGAAEEEAILNEVSAVTYIFMGRRPVFRTVRGVSGGCAGLADGELSGRAGRRYLRMAESEAWKQIGRSDYEDKLREDIYTEEAECAISGSGKVTVY